MKSIWRLRLFHLAGSAQYREERIYSDITCVEQPFPMRNKISLNVSRSPMGFFQNIDNVSLGRSVGDIIHVFFLQCLFWIDVEGP